MMNRFEVKTAATGIALAILMLFAVSTNAQTGCVPPTATPVLFCDGNNATPTSAAFDFNNVGQTSFTYSYSVDGGPPVTGTFNAPSHYNVTGLLPGQSVTFTLTWNGICGPPLTATCSSLCQTTTPPGFAPIAPICQQPIMPILPTTSPSGIAGTWNPSVIVASGPYVFTPSPGQCSEPQTLNITVNPRVTPTFDPIAPVCVGMTLSLPISSNNNPPITGTWSPAVNTAAVGTTTYNFTPAPGQCVTNTPVTATVTVVPNQIPDFAPIAPICEDGPVPQLPATSPNGVAGTWSPATVSNTISRNYTFTPLANQCAQPQTLHVTVIPKVTPTFAPIPAICEGGTAPVLPLVSLNGISGIWTPAVVDNMQTDNYTFVPDAVHCAENITIAITVDAPESPGFDDINVCLGEPVQLPASPDFTGTWTPATADPINGGTYVFQPDPGQCIASQTIQITVNEDLLQSADWERTNFFSSNPTISIFPNPAIGNYLYQLDYGPLQANNVFDHVGPGMHTVTVYDANGCSAPITLGDIMIVGYPLFFTPNGDDYNDYWNIIGLTPDASIFIFDRYGKLLKQLSPTGQGWDGTYNGAALPSSDYWFLVNYFEANKPKEFKAHFSLKR